MSKLLFMLLTTLIGVGGSLAFGPIMPLFVYYFYSTFRPQALWLWQLSPYPEFNWSLYVAAATMLSYLPWVFGVLGSQNDPTRKIFPYFNWTHRIMVGFSIWMTLSYLFSNDQSRSWIYYEDFLKIFVMYMLGTQVIRTFRQIHILYLIVTFSLAYLAFEFVQIYLTTGYLVLYRRGFGGLDNNGAALVLAMGIPLCYFAWEFTKGWYRWGFLLAIPIIAEAIMSSYSRGAMLSALIVLPLYLLYSRKRIFLIICMGSLAIAVPYVAGNEIKDRFFSSSEAEQDESFQSRMMSFRAAYIIANEYPVFGAGIRCSNLLTKQYGADMEGRTIHNTYLQIAADEGWIGMAWYILLLVVAIITMWRTRRRLWKLKDPESIRATAMLGGIECALITFMFGVMALSLEMVEIQYLMILMGTQFWSILNAEIQRDGTQGQARPQALPANVILQARIQANLNARMQQRRGVVTAGMPASPAPSSRASMPTASVPVPTRASVSAHKPPKSSTPPTVPDLNLPDDSANDRATKRKPPLDRPPLDRPPWETTNEDPS